MTTHHPVVDSATSYRLRVICQSTDTSPGAATPRASSVSRPRYSSTPNLIASASLVKAMTCTRRFCNTSAIAVFGVSAKYTVRPRVSYRPRESSAPTKSCPTLLLTKHAGDAAGLDVLILGHSPTRESGRGGQPKAGVGADSVGGGCSHAT